MTGERRLAEQMADRLRDLIKEFESLGRPAPEWVGAKLALIRRLLADLESRSRCNSDVEFRDWNGWRG